MFKHLKRLAFVAVVMGSLSSCTFDNEEGLGIDPVDPNACETTDVSFSQTVFPLLSGSAYGCVGCHQGSGASAGIRLDSHAEVVRWQDRMIGAIAHESGFSPMPKGRAKMNDCEIDQIRSWIAAGSLDN